MPRHKDTIITPNDGLRAARRFLGSPVGRSAGRPAPMGRGEFADAINAELYEQHPRTAHRHTVDADYIGKLERGEIRWPGELRRAAIRAVLGVDSDDVLGFRSPKARTDYDVSATERANRFFLSSAVRVLAFERGVRQFLCLSAGLPSPCTAGPTIARNARPRTRILCAGSSPPASGVATQGARVYPIETDLNNVATVVHQPSVTEQLDLSRPTGLLMIGTLETVRDDREAETAMLQLVDALAPDSYVVFSNCTMDYASTTQTAIYDRMSSLGKTEVSARPRAVIERWATSLELLEPGIVPVAEWQPDDEPGYHPATTGFVSYGFVGRVP